MDSDNKSKKDEDTSLENEDMLDDESLDEVVEELNEVEESNEPAADEEDTADNELSSESDSSSDSKEESKEPDHESIPADALSRTPEDIEQEITEAKAAEPEEKPTEAKKTSPAKKFFKKVNIYILIFVLLLVVVGSITVVYYLNSTKAPVEPGIANQDLTEEELKQLANTDTSIGNLSQTLTIRGSAVIDGQTLMRSNLNVAGNLQTSGGIQSPDITVAGSANLGSAQINTLQVAGNTVLQGDMSLRDLSVSGSSTFSGNMTASQITVTNLILSGNALLQIPNHISFTGPTPGRTVLSQALGSGGSASVNGSDTAGTVNINTGNNPSAGCFVRINFNQSFNKQPHVIVSPIGVAAGKTQYYVERNPNNFSICAAVAAPANQAFAFDYFVTN